MLIINGTGISHGSHSSVRTGTGSRPQGQSPWVVEAWEVLPATQYSREDSSHRARYVLLITWIDYPLVN
jgi:hypothetical protein